VDEGDMRLKIVFGDRALEFMRLPFLGGHLRLGPGSGDKPRRRVGTPARSSPSRILSPRFSSRGPARTSPGYGEAR
jgi:hypothetical protein